MLSDYVFLIMLKTDSGFFRKSRCSSRKVIADSCARFAPEQIICYHIEGDITLMKPGSYQVCDSKPEESRGCIVRLLVHRAAVWFVAMRAAGIPPPTQPRSPQQHSVSV